MPFESEATTRKQRIDKQLVQAGWQVIPWRVGLQTYGLTHHAVEEYPTASGPADYGLFVNGRLLGIIEAKKHGIDSRNVLEQAKRYARGVEAYVGIWGEYRVPFLYSSSGEQVYFLDVRDRMNISRPLGNFHTPQAMEELFQQETNQVFQDRLSELPFNPRLRPYQTEAINAIEEHTLAGRRKMMVAMATGTGKTFMMVSQVYRLLESKAFRRVLFLVDRKALAAQAAVTFSAFETPKGFKFNQEYEIFSQRFKREDLDEESKFDVGVLPEEYLTKPSSSKTFVYVCTIQRMAINLLGQEAAFYHAGKDEDEEADADRLDIPIHAFDLIVTDECHRGYTSKETNVWRSVLEYFDAVKIGMTATPALHTTSYFGEPIFSYPVTKAILEGYLADYNVVKIKSNIRINGIFLQEGEQVGTVDTQTGQLRLEMLEDERTFDSTEVEQKVTSPDSNRKIIREIANHALAFEKETGRFPKILIFAVNDIQNISHADRLVSICKETFDRGDDFVVKITGNPNVDRPLEKIRKFRNRPEPKIVVTVDMLSTGVDIPALEYIVFLRPVKSRILWEQMLGRGTRTCPEINKESFTIFDCFDGTLIEYFREVSNFDMEGIKNDTVPIEEIIRRIDDNEERDYNVRIIIKRLRRIERTMNSEARDDFAAFIPNGDIGRFADTLQENLRRQYTETITLLKSNGFQKLLTGYKRARPVFYIAENAQDEVTSDIMFDIGDRYMKPPDYLEAFSQFVKENGSQIEEMKIILERPKNFRTEVLKELRKIMAQHQFAEAELQKAYEILQQKHPDIISMIKHASRAEEPLLEAQERVERTLLQVFSNRILSDEQKQWLGYIREHLIKNLTIDRQDFEEIPVFEQHGGWSIFRKLFGTDSETILSDINSYIAA